MPRLPDPDQAEPSMSSRAKRADFRRNEEALLDAAARVFAESGVDAPVRLIATQAGVGMGTIYRHFPSRADLVAAVYHHQVDACVDLGERLLQGDAKPFAALSQWIDAFVDFLATKHGLSNISTQSESSGDLHDYFLGRLVPICDRLLAAAREAGEVVAEVTGYALMRGIGNLCLFAGDDSGYDPRKLAHLLLAGTRPQRIAD